MEHQFNIYHAQEYGVNEAILIKNFSFWIGINRANKRHKHEGRTWTYNSMVAFTEIFPYLSLKQIRRVLSKLVSEGVLITGCFNEELRDRTKWYAFIDEKRFLQKVTMQMPEKANAFPLEGKSSYTDSKHTDSKQIKGNENIDNYLIDLNNKTTTGGSGIINQDRTITILEPEPLNEKEKASIKKEKKHAKKKKKIIIYPFTSEAFMNAWREWKLYRATATGKKKLLYNATTEQAALTILMKVANEMQGTEQNAIELITLAIAHNWRSFYAPKPVDKVQQKQTYDGSGITAYLKNKAAKLNNAS